MALMSHQEFPQETIEFPLSKNQTKWPIELWTFNTEGVQETVHDAGRGRDVHLQPQGRTLELKKWMASGQDHPNDNPGDPRWSRSSPPRPGGTQSGSLRSWTRWRRSNCNSMRPTQGSTAGQDPGASATTFSPSKLSLSNMHVWLYFSFLFGTEIATILSTKDVYQ